VGSMRRVGAAGSTAEGPDAAFRALAADLAAIGAVASGSVVVATTTCSTPGCHCRTDPARRHGPYWQWSRSVDGRRRTRRVSEAQGRLLQGWIAERRRAEAILSELEALSLSSVPSLAEESRGDGSQGRRRQPTGHR